MTDRPSTRVVLLCRSYAVLLCAIRDFEGQPDFIACIAATAHRLIDAAPHEALAHLDLIKRVVEIDPLVREPSAVLLRASLLADGTL